MNQIDEKRMVLIKFEPNEVLFMHRETRVVYRYYNRTDNSDDYQQISSNTLLRGVPFNKGVLYEKEQSTLKQEIEQRSRCFSKEYFHEEEIINTFLPLFETLEALHREGLVHGAVKLENIVIVNEEVRLRDWLAAEEGESLRGKDEDWQAMGCCMLNCTFLSTERLKKDELEKSLFPLFSGMSKHFLIVIIIFIRELKSFYKQVISLLSGQAKQVDLKLAQIYEQLRNAHKKATQPQNAKPILTFSPAKKLGLTQKRSIHYQNIENKLELQGKKGKIDKPSPVQELMNKRLNEEEKKVKEQANKRGKEKPSIINLSNFGVENNSRRFGFKDRTSPLQKLRTFSKKK